MKQQLENTDRNYKGLFFNKRSLVSWIVVLFLTLFIFGTQFMLAQSGDIDTLQEETIKEKGKWSYTFQVGWATNIDFSVNSTSQDYRFQDNATGIGSRFYSYDSRAKISELEGDQANNYVITITNKSSGFTITTGVIHDKKQQLPNPHDNRFKYEKGGMSPVLLLGFEHDFSSLLLRNISVQFKAGGFLSFNKIDANLINDNSNIKYEADNRHRTYSGGGSVAMAVVSYQYYIYKDVSISFLVNATMMAGKALTSAKALNEITENERNGQLSVRYSSLSVGPSLGFTFVK